MRGRLVLTAFLLVAALVSSLAASSSPAVATGTCGDTVVDETEQCDDGNTVPGDGCDENCRMECEAHCDCPQGQFCFYGTCTTDPKMPVYCCEKEGCPPGSSCINGDGTRSTCAEDPAHWCDTPCDCGPAHCCKDNMCVKDINDPKWPGGVEVGSPCVRGVDATYCATASSCEAGMLAYEVSLTDNLADFRCQLPTGEVQPFCTGYYCHFSGDCGPGDSCVDAAAYPDVHPGLFVSPDGGVCKTNAAAEAVYGFTASDLLAPCTNGVPGARCEAGWRPANTATGFAIERVVGTTGSCGNNVCEFALLETSANCPADCSCGDGYCDTSEVGTCTADCGACDENGCDQTVMPLEWTALSTCGDGVCQKDGEIPEDCVNCWLDCDAETDSDGDGTADGCDGCPDDPGKVGPGVCGCSVPDIDSDGDGVPNCNDGCVDDPGKTEAGVCGCGIADADSDADGLFDCLDNCPTVANSDQADMDGDSIGDACDQDVDGDGVTNENDMCPDTPTFGTVTTDALKNNRYAVDTTGAFTSASGRDSGHTITDTAGCDEHQIIDELGLGGGQTRFGLSGSALDLWIDYINQ